MFGMQEHKYSIRNWAKDDRPREKLLSSGAVNLSNSELLAVLLRSGARDKSAVQLARDLLNHWKNNLGELSKATPNELMKIKGIGLAKAMAIVAALELGRRRQFGRPLEKITVRGSTEIAGYLQSQLRDYRHEVFGVIYMNRANRVKHFEILSEGGITATVADPRIIMRRALEEDAVNIIIYHNHPSGNLKPSNADKQLTAKLKAAAAYLDISLLDHIIVSEEGYYSFADSGEL